jgi:hypothetical protein
VPLDSLVVDSAVVLVDESLVDSLDVVLVAESLVDSLGGVELELLADLGRLSVL